MPLFTNTSDLLDIVGATVNGSINIEDIQPDFDLVMEDIITPLIGDELLEEIQTRSEPIYVSLLAILKKAVAYLGLHEFSRHASVHMSSNGMMRVEGEGARSSFRYQEYDYQDYTLTTGWDAVEKLLIAAEAGKQDLIDENSWSEELRESTQSHLLSYAKTMRQLYHMRVSRNIFEMMRPVIDDVENYMIRPILTDAVYDAAIAYRVGLFNNPPDNTWDGLIKKAQRAIVHIVVRESVLRNWVRIDKEGIIAIQSDADQSPTSKMPASDNQLNVIAKTHQDWAIKVIGPLREYLVANAVALEYVIPEAVEDIDDIESCQERIHACACRGACGCGGRRGKTVVSF